MECKKRVFCICYRCCVFCCCCTIACYYRWQDPIVESPSVLFNHSNALNSWVEERKKIPIWANVCHYWTAWWLRYVGAKIPIVWMISYENSFFFYVQTNKFLIHIRLICVRQNRTVAVPQRRDHTRRTGAHCGRMCNHRTNNDRSGRPIDRRFQKELIDALGPNK